MITLQHQDWERAVNMIKNIPPSAKNKYFQTFPFFLLSETSWEELLSENFFYSYIKSGEFLTYQENLSFYDRTIQKSHGAYRQTRIVSPIIYIFLIAIASQVERIYVEKRTNDMSVYFSGSFEKEKNTAHYKQSYNTYMTELNACQEEFDYYFQTDFSTFFHLVDTDNLFNKIDRLDPKSALVYSSLIKMIGQGRMPIVDGNSGLSFLNTVVYLDDFDKEIIDSLKTIVEIESFKLVRYVDDLHIFIKCANKDLDFLNYKVYNLLCEKATKHHLEINSSKTKSFTPTSELSTKMNTDLYNFFVYNEDIDFEQYFSKNTLIEFLDKLNNMSVNADFSEYEKEVLHTLENPEIVSDGSYILNAIVYNKSTWSQDYDIKNKISLLVNSNYRKLRYSAKTLITLVLNTRDGDIIKGLLNNLFTTFKNGTNDIIDEIILIEYLVQRKFNHKDLMTILKTDDHGIKEYIKAYQTSDFIKSLEKNKVIFYTNQKEVYPLISKDTILNFIYFRAKYFESLDLVLESFAYYKNYFDRFVAHAMFCTGIDSGRKPNYKLYYTEGKLIDGLKQLNFLSSDEITKIINEAHKIRNSNPVSHSSAGLLQNEDFSRYRVKSSLNDLKIIIEQLSTLLQNKNRL